MALTPSEHYEDIVCKTCNSEYEVFMGRTNWREKGTFNCHICKKELYSWNEAKDFTFRAKKLNEDYKKSSSTNNDSIDNLL